MPTPRRFARAPDVIGVPHRRAFIHAHLSAGVDCARVEDDPATAIATGDGAHETGSAGFGAASFDLAASTFPGALDARGRGQRVVVATVRAVVREYRAAHPTPPVAAPAALRPRPPA